MENAGWPLRVAALASGVLGIAIVGMWTASLAGGWLGEGIGKVENNTLAVYHLAAELGMGVTLIVSAAMLRARSSWAATAAAAGFGMVVYSTVNSLSRSVRNQPELTPILLVSLLVAVMGLVLIGRR